MGVDSLKNVPVRKKKMLVLEPVEDSQAGSQLKPHSQTVLSSLTGDLEKPQQVKGLQAMFSDRAWKPQGAS